MRGRAIPHERDSATASSSARKSHKAQSGSGSSQCPQGNSRTALGRDQGFPPQWRMAIFKKCMCNADRISPGRALPPTADESASSAAQLSQWVLGARFLWSVSGEPGGQSPPTATMGAVRSVDPLRARHLWGAGCAKSCAARRTNPTVWLLNSGLMRIARAMRCSEARPLCGLATRSSPLRRRLLSGRQARSLRLLILLIGN